MEISVESVSLGMEVQKALLQPVIVNNLECVSKGKMRGENGSHGRNEMDGESVLVRNGN